MLISHRLAVTQLARLFILSVIDINNAFNQCIGIKRNTANAAINQKLGILKVVA